MKWRDRVTTVFMITSSALIFLCCIRVGLDCLEVLGWLN